MSRCHQVTFASSLVTLLLSGCISVSVVPGAVTRVYIPPTSTVPVPLHAARRWPASANCPGPARGVKNARLLVALMNAERAKHGLTALVQSSAITATARKFACEAAARNDIGHVGSDGSTLTERLQRSGVLALMVAENTGSLYHRPGDRTAAEAMAAWMASPHHRANILRPEARAVGVGLADGAQEIWVVDFTS